MQKQQADAGPGSGTGVTSSVAAVATAGVARLLNAMGLTTGEANKLCENPWPTCEHPQLDLTASPLSRVIGIHASSHPAQWQNPLQTSLVLSSSVASISSITPSQEDSVMRPDDSKHETADFFAIDENRQSDIGQLVARLTQFPILESMPDVYVNDSEMTSLIAYALTCVAILFILIHCFLVFFVGMPLTEIERGQRRVPFALLHSHTNLLKLNATHETILTRKTSQIGRFC